MFILDLTRRNSSIRVPLRLPASPAELDAAQAKLEQIDPKAGEFRIARVIDAPVFLIYFLSGRAVSLPGELNSLNELAQKMEQMSEQEVSTFMGALNAECVNTLEEILQVADSLNDYVFITGVTTEKELGRFLVDSGYKGFPENVRPYLDYTVIGKEYLSLRVGAFTAEGFTLQRSSDAGALPFERAWWPPLFRVCLQTRERGSAGTEPYSLKLPATPEQIQAAEEILGVCDLAEAEVVSAECLHESLKPCIPLQKPDAHQLQDMSVNLSAAMDNYGEELVLAVFEARKPWDLSEAGDLAISIDLYELVTDAEEYGKNALYDLCADDEIIATVDGYMDWDAFGQHMMEEDGLIPTDHGYLRLLDDDQPDMEQTML